MRRYRRTTWPEETALSGEIILSHNHIALLQGLYDRPAGRAPSCTDWLNASFPYVTRFRRYPSRACLELATRTVNPLWATRTRVGRRIEVSLTDRGRAILDRKVRVRIRGWGTYEGLKQFQAR